MGKFIKYLLLSLGVICIVGLASDPEETSTIKEIEKVETVSNIKTETNTSKNSTSSISSTVSNNKPITSISSDNKKEETVYKTKTGSKYHRNGCQYLRKSKIAVTKENAIRQGLTPCSRCNP